MPDRSMKVWLLRLFCDYPDHVPQMRGPVREADFQSDWLVRADGLVAARKAGWVLRQTGETICPECARRTATPTT